jgi:protein-disulfide isomerase
MEMPMKRLISRLRIDPYFSAGVVAVLVIGAVYRTQLPRAHAEPLPLSALPPGLTRTLDGLGAGRGQGAPDAPVRVVELFDYQCPACAAAEDSVGPLVARLVREGRVRYTSYDLPLPGHANAIPAAVVASCVAEGDPRRFTAVRRRLFATQGAWAQAYPAEPALLAAAAAAGADSAALGACVERTGSARAALYRRTWEAARAAGVTFTPAWAVNGKVVPWARLPQELDAALRAAGSTGP